jgi:hypothetical protein
LLNPAISLVDRAVGNQAAAGGAIHIDNDAILQPGKAAIPDLKPRAIGVIDIDSFAAVKRISSKVT